MRVVITGPSCSGKTSLIKALCRMGFNVVSEAARDIIKKNKKADSDLLPWIDFYGFELEVINKQLMAFNNVDNDDLTFFDRGIHDAIGFMRFKGYNVPPHIKKKIKSLKYDLIIYLSPLNSYGKDDERWEDEETAKRIGELIVEEYKKAGFKVIKLPKFSKDKNESIKFRLRAILNAVGTHAKDL